jgi:NAD(P)-dependent dehydrogenase (short-subunit alcohol dehydrogenase family)
MVAEPAGDPRTLFAVAGKRVLVTGGSRGIGRMIAHGFLAAGASVLIAARKAEECHRAAEELSEVAADGATVLAVPGDVASPEGVAALVEAVEGRLDVLVNNAGATWGAPLEDYPAAAWRKVLGVNVEAVFALTVALLPALRAAASPDDPSRVVTIGSVDGIVVPGTENYAYAASKAARLAAESITVNAVAPGPFDSRMMAWALDDQGTRERIAASVPLGRVGRPDDMAGVALWLASRAGSYVTGAVIPVDGGITAR